MSFDGHLTIVSSCKLKKLDDYKVLFEKQKVGDLLLPNLAFRINYVEPDLQKDDSNPYNIDIHLVETTENHLKFHLIFADP